jgi:Lon protease-like protein
MRAEIPLFPLNLVLFPGMPLTLHIFEERYKAMVRHCLDHEQPFGVVLIKHGQEALGPLAEPHLIGTTARIFRVEKLTKGRMHIIAVGEQRFKLLDWHITPQDFMQGEVEYLAFAEEPKGDLYFESDELRPWLRNYLSLLERAGMLRGTMKNLPPDPIELGYLAAYLLQTPARHKQILLEQDTGADLLAETRELYRKEVVLMRALEKSPPPREGIESQLN